jgi:hypothetical protein
MKKFYSLALAIFLASTYSAQMQVTPSISDETLEDWIEGTDVIVSNLIVECDSAAYGTFLNPYTDSNLEVVEGVLFATGLASNAVLGGQLGYLENPYSGDPDLEMSLPGFEMNDVCRIEFDVVPLFEYMLFDYVFGSEEYPEWVGSSFNDIFGFFVSGPGITGTFTNGAANYSNVPGTDLPVAINNVNIGLNADYYIDNEFSSDSSACAYDGLTTNLPGIIECQPSGTYHVKIVIADVLDSAFDSGVFLQKESFMSVPSIVGIEELSSLNLDIFPNPTSEYLNLNGDDLQVISSYKMLNIEGKVVQFGSLSGDRRIDVQELSNGTYTMILMNDARVAGAINWVKK